MKTKNNVFKLRYNEKEIILIATAHVLTQSVELVKKVIDEEQPDSICVELDDQRYKNIQNPNAWEKTDIINVIKSKKTGSLLASLVLSSYQKRIAKRLNTNVGQEMIQGIECAEQMGAHLVLADRDIQITFRRIWRKLNFWEKCKLIFSLIFSLGEDAKVSDKDFDELLQKDILESALKEMRGQFPKIGDILIDERDQHLASKIKEASGKKVVAILGGAHVPGVKKQIFKTQNIAEISKIPPKSPVSKIVGWIIPILILGLIAYGFFRNTQTGLQQLTTWVLWNSVVAALFTAVSLGHPLSILTSFLIAPISSLNPMLACGWFAGLVEATVRKPTVKDVNNIPENILSIGGFFKNRFLRILLVVIMANLGSCIGTVIAGMDIIKNLF